MRSRASLLLFFLLACQLALGMPVMHAPTPAQPSAADMHCMEDDGGSDAMVQPAHDPQHDCCGLHVDCHCSAVTGLLGAAVFGQPRASGSDLLSQPPAQRLPSRADELFRPPIA